MVSKLQYCAHFWLIPGNVIITCFVLGPEIRLIILVSICQFGRQFLTGSLAIVDNTYNNTTILGYNTQRHLVPNYAKLLIHEYL
jgi:hypothetical protein